MKTLQIELTELAEQYIQDAADAVEVLNKEALRRFYIARSKPRERKPVGRPPTREFNQRAETLREIYRKLRKMLGTEFEAIYGQQVADLEAVISAQDMDKLTVIFDTQPWLRKRWTKLA